MISLVILDRDGVINFDSAEFIKSPEEWRPIPGSLEAIAKLNRAGIRVAVASNQSGVGRKLFDHKTLELIQQKMQETLKPLHGHIDLIVACTHHPDEACECRKPKTGLFLQIASHFNIDFHKTPVPAIGDSLRDLEAAQTAGCTPLLVLTGNGQKTRLALTPELKDVKIFENLSTAVDALLMDLS
jgi:D-glycero-D-manno-heptose 1,7-bisphosphate phosphatase